ncbi:MAG: YqgE/AlgH family protein [Burkholderiaceae bacterium]|nr:YqgE/AlgH family protein [Burkholderiaceae bacterium]MCD8517842.1 YqgE/AlgH family protein [Burkholderiaceae bacterium]MCD8535970.1 YqgE/AlgH family protein [Burkholderiaceae bacterium]MCD8564618.1 YqgE/AlgH family protein [Burkholderiaceae bacterium]
MSASVDLSGHFLMAMPGMVEGDLAGTVIYVCEHSERGALGLVINRPTDLSLGSLLEQVDVERDSRHPCDLPVHFGGPVQSDRGFVLHKPAGDYSSSIRLGDSLALTTSRDVLQAVASGKGPDQIFVTLGYAGWGAGQLEQELAQNAWLSVPAEESIIFEEPAESRYPAAMRLLGVDPAMLAGSAGHA